MNKAITKLLASAVLAIGLAANANAQALCQASFTYSVSANGHVDFTNTSTGTTPTTDYHWYFGDNTTANTQNTSHDYAYNGTYHVTLQIDSSGGCSSTATDSIVITNGLTCTLNPAFTYTAGTSGAYNFTNSSTGVDPGMTTSWEWYGANGYGNGSGSTTTLTFPYNGNYNVTMYVGDPTQTCYRSISQTIVVTNSQPCVVDFTYTITTNGQVDFTNISVGNSNYRWDFADGNTSTLASPSHTFYNGTYHVTMSADTANGACGGWRDTTITITNGQNAPSCTAGFTYSTGSNGVVNFTNTSSGSSVALSCEWSFGDGNTLNSPSGFSSPSHTYTYNGTYNVTLYEKDSLTGTVICQNTQSIVITTGLPNTSCTDTAYFYMYRDSTMISTWNVYLATNTGNCPSSAVWYWGDGTSSTGLAPTHSYSSPGQYSICVKAYFACGDSSYYCQNDSVYRSGSSMVNMVVINTTTATGIKTVTNNIAGMKLYPNPFSDNLTLELNSANSTSFTYTMSDVYGQQVMNEKVSAAAGENKIQINTGNVSSGVYFVTVVDNATQKVQTIKVVK